MPQDSSSPQGFRVLVIVSRPLDLEDLPNIADQWALLGGLRRVNAPAFLKILRPPTVEGIRSEILSGYDIVHFDGHGSFGVRCPNCGGLNLPQQKECSRCEALLEGQEAKGYFAFEREDGKLDSLAAEELAEIVMSAPEHPTKLVFLSACESAKGGNASIQNVLLDRGVPAVLGMNEPVPAKATMALAAPFYAGLGAGMTIDGAFETALPALKRLENGGHMQKIPVLEGLGKDVKILPVRAAGKASFEAERLYGVPEYEFVGDYIRGDPPRGRKGVLSQAMNALKGGEKLVVLTGQGGIGKTVLAAEAARRLSWRYPGGVFWRSAADMERLGLNELLDALAEVLGWEFRTLPLDAKRDRALNYLRNYYTASLMVVDNAEKIKDANLWRFLESIPEPSAALVTTRESLPREGKEIRVMDMEVEEASRLFIIEARRRSPKWGENLNDDEMNSLKEISSIMQGHPLAIKLTAALVASRSLESIRDELRRNPPQEVLDRFDVSYADLTKSQKELLGCLAVFTSSVTDYAIKNVCGKEDPSNWEKDLGELVRKSFLDRIEVEARDESGKDVILYRYRMHPLMRQYAGAKAEREMWDRLRETAANYFLGYAQNFSENFDMLEWEKENILSGMVWAVDRRDQAEGEVKMSASRMILQFMYFLDGFLDTRGYWNEYGISLHQAIESADVLQDRTALATWVQKLGIHAQKMGNYPEARQLFQQSLKISQELGYKSGMSRSLHQMGMLAQNTGEYDKARQLYQQSLKIKQELGDRSGVSSSLQGLGALARATGEYDEARNLYQQSLKISQELGDKRGMSCSQHQLGILAQDTGEYDEARKLYQHDLKILQELRDKSGMAISQVLLALLEKKMGNVNEALRLIHLAEAAFLELESPDSSLAREVRERLEKNQ